MSGIERQIFSGSGSKRRSGDVDHERSPTQASDFTKNAGTKEEPGDEEITLAVFRPLAPAMVSQQAFKRNFETLCKLRKSVDQELRMKTHELHQIDKLIEEMKTVTQPLDLCCSSIEDSIQALRDHGRRNELAEEMSEYMLKHKGALDHRMVKDEGQEIDSSLEFIEWPITRRDQLPKASPFYEAISNAKEDVSVDRPTTI